MKQRSKAQFLKEKKQRADILDNYRACLELDANDAYNSLYIKLYDSFINFQIDYEEFRHQTFDLIQSTYKDLDRKEASNTTLCISKDDILKLVVEPKKEEIKKEIVRPSLAISNNVTKDTDTLIITNTDIHKKLPNTDLQSEASYKDSTYVKANANTILKSNDVLEANDDFKANDTTLVRSRNTTTNLFAKAQNDEFDFKVEVKEDENENIKMPSLSSHKQEAEVKFKNNIDMTITSTDSEDDNVFSIPSLNDDYSDDALNATYNNEDILSEDEVVITTINASKKYQKDNNIEKLDRVITLDTSVKAKTEKHQNKLFTEDNLNKGYNQGAQETEFSYSGVVYLSNKVEGKK